MNERRPRVCDTYTVWSPTACTVTARCCCGWAGDPLPQWDVVGATKQEMEHLREALERQLAGTP